MTTSTEGTSNMLINTGHSDLLKPYHAIQMFVHEMNELYGDSYKPLAMYSRLLERTEDRHEDAIRKHVQSFRKFVIANRKSILDKNEYDMRVQKVKYSEHVFINVHTILGMADAETKEAIWQHLLVLSALLDANSAAKRQLQQQKSLQGRKPGRHVVWHHGHGLQCRQLWIWRRRWRYREWWWHGWIESGWTVGQSWRSRRSW